MDVIVQVDFEFAHTDVIVQPINLHVTWTQRLYFYDVSFKFWC